MVPGRGWAGVLVCVMAASPWGVVEAAQPVILEGRVWSEDGVPVVGAVARVSSVADSADMRVTETDQLGFFAFRDLPSGVYVIAVGRIGFAERRERVEVRGSGSIELEIVLAERAIELEGLEVDAARGRERTRFDQSAGATVHGIERAALRSIPGLVESDPLRAIEVLPGVTTVSDFSAAFNVRGGSADPNLILLDDMQIYNPFHLGGFFSVFNADMVQRAELRAGGFPAEYGGRVSSVLTVESDAGDGETSVDTGVSLLAARVAVGGALADGMSEALGLANTRWRVSGRRSYVDLLVKPWWDFPYHLSDAHGIFEAWTKGGDRIRFTGYSGRDVLDMAGGGDSPGIRSSWGNDAVGGSWVNPMRGGGWVGAQVSFSRFGADLGFDGLDAVAGTSIQRASVQADIERRPTAGTRWQSGVAVNRRAYENVLLNAGGADSDERLGQGFGLDAYSQVHWKHGVRWLLEAGLRLDHWWPDPGSPSTTLSPRFAVKRFLGDGAAALRLSAGRYIQFVHSIRDEELPVGVDIWVLTGDRAPHVVSDQVQAGVETFLGEDESWYASVEAYHRTLDGIVSLNFADAPGNRLDDLVAGTGRAYGMDLFVGRSAGATTGWISVSFLRARRTFPDTRTGILPPPTITYPPVFDRRLDVDLVLRRPLGWWALEGGLRANFGTGLPYSVPLGDFHIHHLRLVDGFLVYRGQATAVYGPRHGARYPARHRLDISLRKTVEKKWGTITPYVNVINVYNQKNILFYWYDYWDTPPTRTGVSMFPILPTFGVDVSF